MHEKMIKSLRLAYKTIKSQNELLKEQNNQIRAQNKVFISYKNEEDDIV